MITDNEMAIGGHYEYLPKADTVTLREIVEDRERRYESRFRWEAQDELRRRAFAIMHGEQAAQPEAQPTPGPWLYEKSGINWRVYRIIQVSRTTTALDEIAAVGREEDAALIARALELAAENERLRGLLAEARSELIGHHLSRAADLGMQHDQAMGIINQMPLMQQIAAAIEAAKEATK